VGLAVRAIIKRRDENRNKELFEGLITEYQDALREFRQNDSEELKKQVIDLGKNLIEKYPQKCTAESLERDIQITKCIHNERKYKQTLSLLKNNSENSTLRNQVRDLGKWLMGQVSATVGQ